MGGLARAVVWMAVAFKHTTHIFFNLAAYRFSRSHMSSMPGSLFSRVLFPSQAVFFRKKHSQVVKEQTLHSRTMLNAFFDWNALSTFPSSRLSTSLAWYNFGWMKNKKKSLLKIILRKFCLDMQAKMKIKISLDNRRLMLENFDDSREFQV